MKVAIDGPAGAGKSVLAKAAAKDLGFIYVDTGALYRGIGLYALRRGADTACPEQVVPLLSEIHEEIRFIDGEQHVFLNGEDVSGLIRTEEVSKAASEVSAIPAVRDFLFDMQRNIADKNDVIMDGRDIGTAVLPDAEVKIFLTAKPEVRALRRLRQLEEKGIFLSYDEILRDVNARDYNDTHRAFRPLRQAEDAVLLDDSEMTLGESTEKIKEIILEAKCR
ncbi:MAG: (d)CMP kinase [Oscillospiraceae bacterium]